MGLENFREKEKKYSFEDVFADLAKWEKSEKEKIKLIFQENAELSLMLANDGEVEMTEHQKSYYMGQLNRSRQEAKEVFEELRDVTGFEAPKELQGIQAADSYYEEIRNRA
jgi:hypothetical protein